MKTPVGQDKILLTFLSLLKHMRRGPRSKRMIALQGWSVFCLAICLGIAQKQGIWNTLVWWGRCPVFPLS